MVVVIIVDSNIWIFGEIDNAPEHEAAVKRYKSITEKDTVAVNAVIISEVFHKLSRLVDKDMAYARVSNILQNYSIEWLDIARSTAMGALNLSKSSNLKINDALIARQALELGADIFTDDLDFRRVNGLGLIYLR